MTDNKEEITIDSISDAARDEKVSELEILRQSLDERKKESDDYYNQLLRLKAEFENFRRRSENERKNHINWGKEEVLLKQMRMLDVLEQAVSSSKNTNNVESIMKGLELIHQEFKRMMAEEGVLEIVSAGAKFDPDLHEAVEQVESEAPEGSVVEVLQNGYKFKDKVIRHAKVKVAKPINNENNN